MCSSGSVFPVNLVIAGSFIPAGMIELRMLGEKGSRPASLVLVFVLACLATLAERASTCHCKATIASVWVPGLQPLERLRHGGFAAPVQAHFPSVLGEYGYRSPPHPPGRTILPRGSFPSTGGVFPGAASLRWPRWYP
ncbi:hypothetical protein LIER_03149 [Lithospermum erythrorhizon]|uniref:Uncharacterized protein n=1 Tax=Lithospermum erythrorhizon TaxID=34254 RepID=A0AAV3NS34_LITER